MAEYVFNIHRDKINNKQHERFEGVQKGDTIRFKVCGGRGLTKIHIRPCLFDHPFEVDQGPGVEKVVGWDGAHEISFRFEVPKLVNRGSVETMTGEITVTPPKD